jgi:hypothetical protein
MKPHSRGRFILPARLNNSCHMDRAGAALIKVPQNTGGRTRIRAAQPPIPFAPSTTQPGTNAICPAAAPDCDAAPAHAT